MHKLVLAAVAAVVCLSPVAALAAESRTLELPAFTGVDIASGIKAEIVVGATQSVVATGVSAADFNDFRAEVRNGVLHVWYNWSIGQLFDFGARRMVLKISATSLTSLESSSGAWVGATGIVADRLTLETSSGARLDAGTVKAKTYDLQASSGATLVVAGTCFSASVDVSSGASIDAPALACANVSLDASSGAHLEIGVSESLTADVSSGAGVTVHGRPRVDSLDADSGGNVSFVE